MENHKRPLKRLGESLACPPSFKEMRDGSRLFYSFVQLMKISKNNTGIWFIQTANSSKFEQNYGEYASDVLLSKGVTGADISL